MLFGVLQLNDLEHGTWSRPMCLFGFYHWISHPYSSGNSYSYPCGFFHHQKMNVGKKNMIWEKECGEEENEQ